MDIYIKKTNGDSIVRYESNIIPRTGEWIAFADKKYKVLFVLHRTSLTIDDRRTLQAINVTVIE